MTVIIPVAGHQPELDDQLVAVHRNRYDGWWELLLVDNGADRSTRSKIEEWAQCSDQVRVVRAVDRPGITYARNQGAAAARGELLVFCDADDLVDDGWIGSLTVAASVADMVGGRVDTEVLNDATTRAWRPSPTANGLPVGLDFLPHVVGANFAIWKDVYDRVGGCDEGFRAGDDVDLSWRVQLTGGTIAYAADAVVHYRLRHGLRNLERQMFAYGIGAALLYRKFGSQGARRLAGLDHVKYWIRLLARAPVALSRASTRGDWLRQFAFDTGRLYGYRHGPYRAAPRVDPESVS
ncbi:MAG TPA: glycosyltransferase [Acidimicrobiales bacterium]|nr:glycosyltransferase [Acidimicrobiales bacterium]